MIVSGHSTAKEAATCVSDPKRLPCGHYEQAFASVLTTVNAPCSVQLDDAALADCFADLDLAKQHPAHVSAFLGEVPLAQQVEFATAHHIRGRRDEGFCRQVLCLVRRKLSARRVMAGHDSRGPSEWRRLFRIIST